MNSIIKKSIWFAIVLSVFAPGAVSHSQVSGVEPDKTVLIEMSPKYPAPGDLVAVKVTSFNSDLNTANITWYEAGKKISSGKGNREIKTVAKDIGTATVVNASITTADGDSISQSITIKPARIDLFWESSSYVPPFYKGKALVGQYSDAKIIASPKIKDLSLSQNSYIFTWSKDGKILGSQSGYGKNVLNVKTGTTDKPSNISVSISADNKIIAQNSIILRSSKPKLVVYEYSPAYGALYNKSINTSIKIDKEISFYAVPYFIASSFNEPDLNTAYSWALNGTTLKNTGSILTLRNDSTTNGSSAISASAKTNALNKSNDVRFSVEF